MTKQYMVGTVDDKPLLMVTLGKNKYLVDVDKKEVFSDTTGIPRVTDKDIIDEVLKNV